MKTILPILICSAISAALGYYFGHITVPDKVEVAKPAAAAPANNTAAFTAQPDVSTSNQTSQTQPVTPEPQPVEPSSEPASTPSTTDNAFAQRAAATMQTLTDTQGRTIQASIVEVMDTEVKIRRSDGLETKIPLSMLSEEDVAFCNYLRKQQQTKEVKAPDNSDSFDWDAYFNS